MISGRTSHVASNATGPVSCPPVISMSGRGDEVDVVLAHRVGEVHRDRVAERLLAGGGEPDAGLEHLARRLAGAEAGQADLVGDLAERLVDVAVELRLVDRDRQLDELLVGCIFEVSHYGLDHVLMHRSVDAIGRRGSHRADCDHDLLEAARARQAACRPARSEDRRQGRSTVDLDSGRPRGTEGKVILANGFNWLRYRVLSTTAIEVGDLDQRNIDPIGRTAKRLAKAAKRADPAMSIRVLCPPPLSECLRPPRGVTKHSVGAMTSLRHRFPGVGTEWARFDGPAGTQMVDSAITAMSDWMASGNTAANGGPFAAAEECQRLMDRTRADGRAVPGG